MELQPIVGGGGAATIGDMSNNAFPQNINPVADSTCETIGVTIIYDDRTTALRAKRFSDMLTASCGHGRTTPACWRSELLELPELAEEIARDAAASEFVILSLRGDAGLSVEMKAWIESWLAGATGGPASLVALFDPERSIVRYVESARCYFRHVTGSAGVAFFGHYATAKAEGAIISFPTDDEPEVSPKPRRCARKVIAPFFPAVAAA
jgi:hypothetical protein